MMDKIKKLIKDNYSDIIKPSVVLLCICIIIPLALSFTNKITADRIASLSAENEKKTMAQLIVANEFKAETYSKETEFNYNVALKEGETVGYIFVTSSKGYGGDVSVMTAVNTDGSVKSVAILDVSNETPGLGQNAAKSSFYNQYSEKTADVELVKNGADSEKNQVNAVTGATITSRAVTNAVNSALENYSLVTEVTGNEE